MSDKKKHPRALAMVVAKDICGALRGACEKLMVAGSLRRGKSEVSDVEVVYAPAFEQSGFFAEDKSNMAEMVIDGLVKADVIRARPNVNGFITWGAQNKLAIHTTTGVPVDLFSTTLERWFVTAVIRTGPKELNLRLIEGAARRGLKLHAYGVFEDSEGRSIVPKSEEEVFDLCGIPFLKPEERI